MKILLLNQAFHPDTVSSGQHASDLAVALAERGHIVTAIASVRGYDNPGVRFARHEVWRGVDIHRIASTGFGKDAKWKRAADFTSFLTNCAWRLMTFPRQDVVIAMTSPPLIAALGAAFVRAKGGSLVSWVLDLNPDEAIAAGWLREGSLPARLLESILRFSLRSSARVIAMDRFMARRVGARGAERERLSVVPPWPHDNAIAFDESARMRYRNEHSLDDKFVVMYAGNQSPCHPLTTLLEAALLFKDDPRYLFCFAGGGSEFVRVRQFAEANGLANVMQLPYEPLEYLSARLSAADLQVVVMGDPFVGIVHPCKVYNILALGLPFVYIGPAESHITDLAAGAPRVAHGDSAELARVIREAAIPRAALPPEYSQAALVARMTEVVESCSSPR